MCFCTQTAEAFLIGTLGRFASLLAMLVGGVVFFFGLVCFGFYFCLFVCWVWLLVFFSFPEGSNLFFL